MDRKTTKLSLSLSRKRKKEITDDITDSIYIQLNARNNKEDGQESQDTNSSCGRTPESAAKVLRGKETHHNNTKKSIAAWLKKPCSPKIVDCPMCGRAVFLSKINKHLDTNCDNVCDSDAIKKPDDHLQWNEKRSHCKENGSMFCSDFPKGDNDKVSVPVTDDGTMRSKNCRINGRFPQAKEEPENLVLSAISSNSGHAVPKVSRKAAKSKQNVATSKDGYRGVESGIAERDSPNAFNGITKEDFSTQGVHVIYPVVEVTNKEYESDSKVLQTDLNILTSGHLSKISSNCIESVKIDNENIQEQNLKDYEPYYLANFKLVLTTVLSNEDDRQLFNEQDNSIIDLFNGMSPEEQKLYIRLFQRKRGWFRCSRLDYPKICGNLKPILDCLICKGFLEDERELTNLQETLKLIASPELKLLVKSLHISTGNKGSSKEDTIETIVSLAENQKTLFGSLKSVVLKRAKQVLGSCVRVAAVPREVFSRVLLLFTMNVIPDEEDTANNGQAQQLSTLFLANIGRVVYPAYVIDRPTPVFHSHDGLIAFAEAYQKKHEMFMALESNHFEHAYSYYPEASEKFNDILAKLKDDSKVPAALLPEHLRCFSAEWAITKMCYFGVEVLQKWRQYDEAVNQLEILLQQDVFCFDSRGRWFDRLALNLHQHLKNPEKAMEVIRLGLSDPHVRFGRRLALIQRAKRILSSPAFQKGKKKKCDKFADLDLKEPGPPKSITISGTRCAQLGVFIAPEIDQDGEVNHGTKTFCAVEEYALSYYRQQGFDQGIHGEGSTFSSLYCLFMWDIIFSSGISDAFRSPFQAAPLDMCFDSFYTCRKEMIDSRLEQITEASDEKLQEILSTSWKDNEEQSCAGLSWERFTNVEQAKQLVACLGGSVLSGIFARFAQGFRYHRSGLPDLMVWNSSTMDYRIAEVKGPGDKLSTKQQIWLDVLETLGANVEVCYVTDIGAKRLKVSK